MGFASKVKAFLQTSKAKVLGAVAAAAVCVDTASAAVTFSKDNGFTGDFDRRRDRLGFAPIPPHLG